MSSYSEAVCTPFATSIISDYFKEVTCTVVLILALDSLFTVFVFYCARVVEQLHWVSTTGASMSVIVLHLPSTSSLYRLAGVGRLGLPLSLALWWL